MKKLLFIVVICSACSLAAFMYETDYPGFYLQQISQFKDEQQKLKSDIASVELTTIGQIDSIKKAIHKQRLHLKNIDFWLRYLEPIKQKHVNGPLPVEWETEVFEKFEKPYRRTGGGLMLAEQYLDEQNILVDSLKQLIQMSATAMDTYLADSITRQLNTPAHMFLANRLFLLNLAAIYTTGFECPDTSRVIPELKSMLPAVNTIYKSYNASFKSSPLIRAYMEHYDRMNSFVAAQPDVFSSFDRYTFIRDYVNPLFSINQEMIRNYHIYSGSYNDFSLNDNAVSIFDKTLYKAQTDKGIFSFVVDSALLTDIRNIGKLLFYDPILSGNNTRSCASCHNPTGYFNDTSKATPTAFDGKLNLQRNTPSLINAKFNHLLMLDGRELTLQSQAHSVMANPIEMNSVSTRIVEKVMSCRQYADAFKKFLKLTPEETEVSLDHIISSVTFYYSSFSTYRAPFDDALTGKIHVNERVRQGFNIFMSKAQCGTCHFTPLFNGVKPPYVGSEFEVLGVPSDTLYSNVSADSGRYLVNPAPETFRAFRTGSIRNSSFTAPYMHNGVFRTMEQVIDFYDKGGGAGRKLNVDNQTLDPSPLHLTDAEKADLILFLKSLDENITFEAPPASLPASANRPWNKRKVGGEF